jgi:hypothetical protein
MARELPDYHILSVELLRTQGNETLAVFTVVRDRRPVQYVLQGDATGANLRALVWRDRGEDCAMTSPRRPSKGAPRTGVDQGKRVLTGVHLGEPPPKQPPPRGIPPVMALFAPGDGSTEGIVPGEEPPIPGIVSLGMSLLTTAFNLGEWAAANGATPVRR